MGTNCAPTFAICSLLYLEFEHASFLIQLIYFRFLDDIVLFLHPSTDIKHLLTSIYGRSLLTFTTNSNNDGPTPFLDIQLAPTPIRGH